MQLVCTRITHRSPASGLDESRFIGRYAHGDSNAERVKPDKRPSERERREKLAYRTLRVPKSEKRVKQNESGRIRPRGQLISREIIDEHRAEPATLPGCPSRTEPSRKIASGTVLHDGTLSSFVILQQSVEADDIRGRQMFERIDSGVNQLSEHGPVVYRQLV